MRRIHIKIKTNPKEWWQNMRTVMKTYTSVIVIIVAALLLELTTGIMYIAAQKFIQRTMEHTVKREMDATYMNIRNKLANVEVTIDNMAWVVNRDLESSDWMFETPEMLAQYNSFILGFGISFAPYYYPQKGRWCTALQEHADHLVSLRRAQDTAGCLPALHEYRSAGWCVQD